MAVGVAIAVLEAGNIAELLERLHATQFTGSYVTHCAQGVPIAVEFPNEPARVRFDRRKTDRRTMPRDGDRRQG